MFPNEHTQGYRDTDLRGIPSQSWFVLLGHKSLGDYEELPNAKEALKLMDTQNM